MEATHYTVPKLAQLLGVAPSTIRYWIQAGYIERPQPIDSSPAVVYPADAVERIRAWYARRVVAGLCRGMGAARKQVAVLDDRANDVAPKAQ